MPSKVTMPQLGETVTEGTIGKWLKQEGDPVGKYEPLLEVITDKVDTEIPSPAEGKVGRILVPEGETVKVGTELAIILAEGEELEGEPQPDGAERQAAVAAETAPAAAKEAPVEERQPAGTRVTPVVARLATEHGIDLSRIEGRGAGGLVTKKDVEAYLAERERPAAPPREAGARLEPAKQPARPQAPAWQVGQVTPLSPMRRSIAEHMVRSKREAPHVTTVMEADLTLIVQFRERNKERFEEREGVRLTYTPFIVQAVVAGLKKHPYVNSSWTDQGIELKRHVHLGIAVALEDGLLVPVIRNADERSFTGLARAVADLAERARTQKLSPDEVQGGTFTITNHGIFGSLFATPIISQPQCAILGVGAIKKRPVVVAGDAIAVRSMVYLNLTFDHRILDGALADQFLAEVVRRLENFDLAQIEL